VLIDIEVVLVSSMTPDNAQDITALAPKMGRSEICGATSAASLFNKGGSVADWG
jgi:hypothetical protein